MSETTIATRTVSDLAPLLTFLMEHPHLPAPRGVDLGEVGLIVMLTTAEEVQAWAEAIGRDAEARECQGNTHHTTYTFDPFYISALAIVAPEAVSA